MDNESMEVTSVGLGIWLSNDLVGFVPRYMIGWLLTCNVIPKTITCTVISLLLSPVLSHCLCV
jgi:hypothetical protein